MLFILSACDGQVSSSVRAERQYLLVSVRIEGEEIPAVEVYPQGGKLVLASDGGGVLTLGEDSSAVTWEGEGEAITVRINDLVAHGQEENGSFPLALEDPAVMFLFREGSPDLNPPEAVTVPDRTSGKWDGTWKGRMWFENGKGEWADFEYRSMALSGVASTLSDGTGQILLYSDHYSTEMPMARIIFSSEGDELHCVSGKMMALDVNSWGAEISLRELLPSQMRDTIIMHPDIYEYGHYYTLEEEPETVETAAEVLSVSGSCQDADGSFTYYMELTRE